MASCPWEVIPIYATRNIWIFIVPNSSFNSFFFVCFFLLRFSYFTSLINTENPLPSPVLVPLSRMTVMTGELGSSSKIVALFFPPGREVDTGCTGRSLRMNIPPHRCLFTNSWAELGLWACFPVGRMGSVMKRTKASWSDRPVLKSYDCLSLVV